MNSPEKNLEFILNWSPIEKCLLMLSMSILIHIDWLLWKLYIYLNPDLWQLLNIALLFEQLPINLLTIVLMLSLMGLCWFLRRSRSAEQILPYLCVMVFGLSMIRDSYLSGIMSPATSLTFMLSIIVGLFLFERIVIYTTALLAFGLLSWLMLQTLMGKLPYAPLFMITQPVDANRVSALWTASMLWFTVPILVGGIMLLEILLSQWRDREKRVETLSQTDPLTGLYNRRTIYHFLAQLLNQRQTEERLHSLILLDLDFFKQINDQHGHSVGDRALIATAAALKNTIRQHDMVGRFGGEEFIIVIADTSRERTLHIAERCRHELTQLEVYNDHQELVPLSASFGITHFNQHCTIDQVLKHADDALYRAKNLGRNQVVHYDEQMHNGRAI